MDQQLFKQDPITLLFNLYDCIYKTCDRNEWKIRGARIFMEWYGVSKKGDLMGRNGTKGQHCFIKNQAARVNKAIQDHR